MKKEHSGLWVVLLLMLLSVILYTVQIAVFRAPHDTTFYILQDLAFLPLQIAIVTVVLGKYLKKREKAERLRKINVVINAFFSEAGTDLLKGFLEFSSSCDEIGSKLDIQTDWDDSAFLSAVGYLQKEVIKVECKAQQLSSLKELMIRKKNFMIGMIENPNLLEHDTFTDMLLSVFHVMEELMARNEFSEDHRADMAHISNDVRRALQSLLIQWVEYMRHLKTEYPYLYSLEIRKNPFFKDRSVVIGD